MTRGPGLYFSHRSSLEHDPRELMPGHPDTPERLLAIERLLGAEDWLGWQRREAPAAAHSAIELIHDPRQIAQVKRLAQAGGGAIDADTVVGEASYRAALHAAGGACEMVRSLLAGHATLGFSAGRPPGHHAEAQRAMGFCLFNSAAIAAALAIAELGAQRVLILDWDVHHGNGTAAAFRTRADVLYASIHQDGIYPGTGALRDAGSGPGEGYTLNLPVPAGSGEEQWLSLVEHVVLPAARAFAPDLVLISAGFDAHRADPLGGCALQASSFGELARHVREFATQSAVPIGAVLEGGYEPAALARSLRETMLALGDERTPRSASPHEPSTERAATQLRSYWPL
ncbi:MAG TPA: histone deacetylase [Solirubrobacteraceae bacterium]|jgi:acetoin utilization deacetylase AcuC-like enzyme|nr:histone deacetylase [Solirubrobacteraceae bacterium]